MIWRFFFLKFEALRIDFISWLANHMQSLKNRNAMVKQKKLNILKIYYYLSVAQILNKFQL
ncbi:Uncharacterised protein [uncultured archaeon]|nr:Uncharacterised protein [uncultured archaeon]